jgi:ubiquinone/menaquinone biosynthesis C-methylase UbiE
VRTGLAARFDEGMAAYRADFVATMALSPDEDMLDVGCGSGQTTRDVEARARSATGLFSDPDRFRALLGEVGCRDVAFTAHGAPMYFEPDVEDVSAFPAGQHDMASEAAARLRADMHDHTGESGVHYDSAAWFVTARHQT